MKVILINGSPREKGCTYTALKEIADELNRNEIDSEIIYIKSLERSIDKEFINEVKEKVENSSGIIIGSPVYYAAPTAIISSFMTKLMTVLDKKKIALMPSASIASARRAGTTCTIDQLNKFFTISQMPIVSTQYWPMVHGNTPSEVQKDEEGLQTMRILAKNMAYMIKAFDKANIEKPEFETKLKTNFIR
jgi:multimeric flavodoxin WrbA